MLQKNIMLNTIHIILNQNRDMQQWGNYNIKN
jgi:hypothetical protein